MAPGRRPSVAGPGPKRHLTAATSLNRTYPRRRNWNGSCVGLDQSRGTPSRQI